MEEGDIVMKTFEHKDELFDVLMIRNYSACFFYDVSANQSDYDGNIFDKKIICIDCADPIANLLLSKNVNDSDKPAIDEFYVAFKKAIQTPCEEKYFESLISIKINDAFVPMSLSIRWINDENGLASKIVGFIVSIAGYAAGKPKSNPELSGKRPFPVETVMERMMTTKENYAIIQFDIVRFKVINEVYGEEIGDAVLENIRRNLTAVWGRDAVTCRLGADIFAVFTEYSNKNEIECRIKNIQDKLQNYNDIKYKFTFGVYLVTDKSIKLRKMTDLVALARRSQKNNAVQTIAYYEDKFSDELYSRHKIENEMQNALETGQFHVYLQPKCRISDGEIVGAEALVRWIHPEDGIIPPDKFIPVLEENGFVENLDEYVHTSVCKIIRKWIDSGLGAVPISVNVSRVYLNKPNLASNIKRIVNKYNIPIELLQLEITETFENDEADLAIQRLKDNGFTLLMDDFGSGYSSLNTLKNTKFDVIKLDRGFLGHSMLTERGQKIITHTIAMTNDIGLEIVAEGVESNEQAAFLENNGCKCAQGYLYSKPITISEFEEKAFGQAIVKI